jgi:hypothetical protein
VVLIDLLWQPCGNGGKKYWENTRIYGICGTGATMDSEPFIRTAKETTMSGQNEALSRAAAAFGGSVSQQGEVPY